MKKPMQIILMSLIICLLFVLPTSCKKYEEGGKIRKAEEVLTKEWSREKGYKNGSPVSVVPENPQIGEVTENMYFLDGGNYRSEDGNVTLNGTWKLVNKNKQVEITITSPSSKASTYTYDILKLTEGTDGEFIFEHTLNGNTYKYMCRSSS
jgi:hypothetical protein